MFELGLDFMPRTNTHLCVYEEKKITHGSNCKLIYCCYCTQMISIFSIGTHLISNCERMGEFGLSIWCAVLFILLLLDSCHDAKWYGTHAAQQLNLFVVNAQVWPCIYSLACVCVCVCTPSKTPTSMNLKLLLVLPCRFLLIFCCSWDL